MAIPIFTGNVIVLIWDFDQTLIPGYQQEPLFKEFDIDPGQFWAEVAALKERYKERGLVVSEDTLYLNHLLTYVQAGKLPGLSNAKLRELGGQLDFYPGLPDFLEVARKHVEQDQQFAAHGIQIEHYVVSTGLRQMVLGSAIARNVNGVWACEFIEEPAPPGFLGGGEERLFGDEPPIIRQVGYFLDNTTKTRALWEINKGTNIDPQVGVNDLIAHEDRRVPVRNMLVIADGPSDIPMFSIANQYGGRTLGVYNPAQEEHFRNVKGLRDQGRVNYFAEADYQDESAATRWILATLEEMGKVIVRDRERALVDRVQHPGGHVV